MVNFLCQLELMKEYLENWKSITSEYICERVSREQYGLVDWERSPIRVVGTTKLVGAEIKQIKWRKTNYSSLPCCSSSSLVHEHQNFSLS